MNSTDSERDIGHNDPRWIQGDSYTPPEPYHRQRWSKQDWLVGAFLLGLVYYVASQIAW